MPSQFGSGFPVRGLMPVGSPPLSKGLPNLADIASNKHTWHYMKFTLDTNDTISGSHYMMYKRS